MRHDVCVVVCKGSVDFPVLSSFLFLLICGCRSDPSRKFIKQYLPMESSTLQEGGAGWVRESPLASGLAVRSSPSHRPTMIPPKLPTQNPTVLPSHVPMQLPSQQPSQRPTLVPTAAPSNLPTKIPTQSPTVVPSNLPTQLPNQQPATLSTAAPSKQSTNRFPSLVMAMEFQFAPPSQSPITLSTSAPSEPAHTATEPAAYYRSHGSTVRS